MIHDLIIFGGGVIATGVTLVVLRVAILTDLFTRFDNKAFR